MATSEVPYKINDAVQKEQNMRHLLELFGTTFDLEIIQSVAFTYDYDVETTSNILLEMSSNVGAITKQPTEEETKQDNPQQFMSYASAALQQNNCLIDCDTNGKEYVVTVPKSFDKYPPPKMHTDIPAVSSSRKLQTAASMPPKSKKESEFERVILHVRQGTRVLIFMRGLPGSGKSYLARQIVDRGVGLSNYHKFILSTDDYFINKRTGVYEYDVRKLQAAHEWNQQRAYKSTSEGISPIIIDNTNTQMWEMRSYALMGTNFGYRIEIVEPFTNWAFNDKELAHRNCHGVPRPKLKDMLERYEKNITPNKLFVMYNLSYNKNFKPPLNRNYPPIPHVEVYNGIGGNSRNIYQKNENIYVSLDNEDPNYNHSTSKRGINLMNFGNDINVSESNHKIANIDERHLQKSRSIDSIVMNTPTSSTDFKSNISILKPTARSYMEKHVLIPQVNASEPEIKKLCTLSLNLARSPPLTENSGTRTIDKKLVGTNLEGTSTSLSDDANGDDDDIILVSSTKNAAQLNKARNIYPTLDLSSWGLPDNALSSWESWDVVSPLNGPRDPQIVGSVENNYYNKLSLETTESTTNTSASDFALVENGEVFRSDMKILRTRGRNINAGVTVLLPSSPPKKTLLDKSAMTDDEILDSDLTKGVNANIIDDGLNELVSLFPNIPTDYLKDIYEKCKGNLNWAVDLLLDDSKEFLQSLQFGSNNAVADSTNAESSFSDQENDESETPLDVDMEELTITGNSFADIEAESKMKQLKEVTELRKHIEENVEINKDYYSEYLLKIKNQKRGIVYKPTDIQQEVKPSTSASVLSVDEIISINSDGDVEDQDHDFDIIQIDDGEEEQTVELNLGDAVVSKLESMFGFPETFPRGLLPVVQVPMWLAKQLHALYIESLCQQMETQNSVLQTITKQDEEFAKKLQNQERAQFQEEKPTPDLRMIMDEQVASNLYQRDTEQWKKLTPDTLAAKLTRQKLFNTFPSINQTVLLEILHAHNNSYEQTVEILLASTEEDKIYDPDGTVREPPITDSVVREMTSAVEEIEESFADPDVPKTANEYRVEASKHLKRHNDLIQRAQQAYQSKHYAVAQFYSEMAKTHTQLFDQANNLAASAFLQEHSKRLQNFHTLDLHFLYVKEAISALDMFIDTNIQLLHGTKKQNENLFIITGRGKRSGQGKSRIKPAVIGRLKKRNIWFCEINPGLLKIRVRQNSAITSVIP